VAGAYDAQDRMTDYGQAHYDYTYNGELTTKTLPGTPPLVTSYEVDVLGNLLQVELPDATMIDYLIDARNRRVGKKVDGVLVKGWLYQDQLEPVAELDGAGAVVSEFVYGSRAHMPDYMLQGEAMYRIVSDHLGSLRLVVRASDGCVMQKMVHDEWGKVLVDQVCGETCCMGSGYVRVPFGFAGGLYDEQTGLVRFGARDYDPETGRWTAKDPISFSGGSVNLYGYASTDPINYFDADGLKHSEWLDYFGDWTNDAGNLSGGFGDPLVA
jgi:RHS repeat-associated protein